MKDNKITSKISFQSSESCVMPRAEQVAIQLNKWVTDDKEVEHLEFVTSPNNQLSFDEYSMFAENCQLFADDRSVNVSFATDDSVLDSSLILRVRYSTILPKLMVDSTETDGQAEIVMDYVISWCLRRADVICSGEKTILYNYCRTILATLLGIEVNDSVQFEDVQVWKQENRIDLWVELQVNRCGALEKHAILIEDKFFSGLHLTKDSDGEYRNQLEVYKKRFDNHYESQGDCWHKHYALISAIDRADPNFLMYEIATSFGFDIYSFYELLGEERDYEESESDIFNEFWLRW